MKNAILAIGAVAVIAGVALFALSAEKSPSFFLNVHDDIETEYLNFIVKYGRAFEDKDDYTWRLSIFLQNFNFVQQNSQDELELAINKFADWTEGEYKRMLGFIPLDDEELKQYNWHKPAFNIKDTVDWRDEGMVSPIKNQGACGSCWAFSANAYLEAANRIFNKKKPVLAEQQMVECSYLEYGTFGCNGGNYVTGWNYAIDHPITLESVYPYTASDEKECDKVKEKTGKYGVKDIKLVQQGSTRALVEALNRSPISVAIKAEEGNFRFYESGVIREDCGNEIDHAVMAVGYGKDYFIIKNSWGADWGDHGYAKIGFGKDATNGICGILTLPAYAEI